MDMRTPLARVRHLGASPEATSHWWWQRLTALALVPLLLWLVASLVWLAGADYLTVREWVAQPWVALLLILLQAALFHHAQLGVQVVIEDYLHLEWPRLAAIVATKALALVLALIGIFAVIRVSLGA